MARGKAVILLLCSWMWSASGFLTSTRALHRLGHPLRSMRAEPQPQDEKEEPAYFNQPYVDPSTGRSCVDVADLGITMEDISGKWMDTNVHEVDLDDRALNSGDYVDENGNIDWNRMAADLLGE